MTEDEAKTKWCPQIRVSVSGDGPVWTNREAPDCNCIASECMWWVWDVSPARVAEISRIQEYTGKPTGHCGAVK